MLSRLSVSNIALIEDADISFGPGLTVLSGETGAGKTALLSACKLLVGERADSAIIRDGASQAMVEGAFSTAAGDILVKRRFDRSGRSRCWIDGEQVTVARLAEFVGPFVDLHGQHEHQALLSPASHAGYLDAWIGERALVDRAAYTCAFDRYTHAMHGLERLESARRSGREEKETASFVLREIEAVAPQQGEYETLQSSLPALQHAQDLALAANDAYGALYGEGGAVDRLGIARDLVERNTSIDGRLDDLAAQLEDLVALADDSATSLRAYRDGLEFDSVVLEDKLDRLGQLDGLRHRYGPRMEDVFDRLERAQATLELADGSEGRLEAARAALQAADAGLSDAAARLSRTHEEAADPFSQALSDAVSALGMSGAALMVSIIDLPRTAWTAEGNQHIEFLYAPGSAVSPRPLAKIASGGELSRVMLALKGSMTSHGGDATLVFDEVDAGIGGVTASLVAERLHELSVGNQVIVVTHLPQIAAVADRQMHVSKDDAALPRTTIGPVEGEDRVVEIARMLSGQVDEAALAHARELLRGR